MCAESARPDSSIQTKPGTPWTGAMGQGFGVQDSTAKWQGWITALDADSGTVRWKVKAQSARIVVYGLP
jgi:outer membrane protein assembly factor BamB